MSSFLMPNSLSPSNSPVWASIMASVACIRSLLVAPAISPIIGKYFCADNPIASSLALASTTEPVSNGVRLAKSMDHFMISPAF